MSPVDIVLGLIALAVKIYPAIADAISVTEGHALAPALSEILKPGNEARAVLNEDKGG